jgi:APA family basic amino acid/polyamine antiporter
MKLFIKKPIAQLMAASAETEKSLKRTLGVGSLIALGIGAIIGAGIFVRTAAAAGQHAGPAVTISFLIAAAGCALAGLCYAEFASMIPIAGSAYTYSYATMGEFIAWIIGWDLVLEYALGAATVSIGWSQYFNEFLETTFFNFAYSLCDGRIRHLKHHNTTTGMYAAEMNWVRRDS